MKGAVGDGLHAEVDYGQPVWVPDFRQVAMRLPDFRLVMASGPIRELRTAQVTLETGFLVRDRWTLKLPPQVEVQLANGKTLLVGTDNGELVWLAASQTLSLRAASLKLMNLTGGTLAQISEVMVERRPTDNGVRLNLASRPQWDGVEALLSGQVVLPEAALARVVEMFGTDRLPGMRQVLGVIAESLRAHGGTLELQDVSFKRGSVDGGVYGTLNVLPDGRLLGNLAVSAATPQRLEGWLQKAGVVNPRSLPEQIGWRRLQGSLEAESPTARLEVLQDSLSINGQPVGPIPRAQAVVDRLWP
jgi:hypothetical protein